MVKIKIITIDKNLYNKFNCLHFNNEIILKNVNRLSVKKIINSINSNGVVLNYKFNDSDCIVEKIGKLNCDIYLKKPRLYIV